MSNKCYYSYLNLKKKDKPTSSQIKKAYHQQALKYHPDRNLDNLEEATAQFKLISEAYQVLNDPEKKRLYDQYGKEMKPSQYNKKSPIFKQTNYSPTRDKKNTTFENPFELFSKVFKLHMLNTQHFFENPFFDDDFFYNNFQKDTPPTQNTEEILEEESEPIPKPMPTKITHIIKLTDIEKKKGCQKQFNLHNLKKKIIIKIPPNITQNKKIEYHYGDKNIIFYIV